MGIAGWQTSRGIAAPKTFLRHPNPSAIAIVAFIYIQVRLFTAQSEYAERLDAVVASTAGVELPNTAERELADIAEVEVLSDTHSPPRTTNDRVMAGEQTV
ncbi:hypothetical protein ZIOFF_059141 [Zingiber officinale]|uniref:Uncharacterized protein n=1 Tax=Zingiber officinale TaxID=94328 RepID=A0A8J5FEN8_ZINOF|nr:hypothetical protein ZIOFF_059141 [Zingiber officinale]